MRRLTRELWPFAGVLALVLLLAGAGTAQPRPVPAPNVPGGKVVLVPRDQLRAGPNTKTARLPHALRAAIERQELVVPPTYDWTKNNTISFPILGNDQWGDCYYACICHDAQARAALLGSPIVFDPAKVIARYRVLSGGDNGLSDEDVIPEYKKGIVGPNGPHKILDTLIIPSTDQAALDLTGYAFGPQWFTFTVYSSFMSQAKPGAFIDSISGGVDGGHAVLCSGKTSRGRKIETWGMSPSVEIGKNFISKVDPEFVAVFSLEWFDAQGYAPNGQHYSVLAPLWNSMGGNVPVPGPFPAPTPQTVAVPGCVGKSFADSKAACAAAGLSCNLTSGDPAMPVVSQAPVGGTQVAPGSAVSVTTGVTPPPPPPPAGTLYSRKDGADGSVTFTPAKPAGLDDGDQAVLDAIRGAVDALQKKYPRAEKPAPVPAPVPAPPPAPRPVPTAAEIQQLQYEAALTLSRAGDGKPLLVFVGRPRCEVRGYRTVRYDAFPGVPAPAVVLSNAADGFTSGAVVDCPT
jgi:hypothetical protein